MDVKWSTKHALALYRTFAPDSEQGLARLVELLIYTRGGIMSMTTVINILTELNEGITHSESDFSTFIDKHCDNIKFVITDGAIKCKFVNR